MISVSSSEILLVAVVALCVWGPTDFLRVLRSIGFLWGKWSRSFYNLYYQMNQELQEEDLQCFEKRLLAKKAKVPLKNKTSGDSE